MFFISFNVYSIDASVLFDCCRDWNPPDNSETSDLPRSLRTRPNNPSLTAYRVRRYWGHGIINPSTRCFPDLFRQRQSPVDPNDLKAKCIQFGGHMSGLSLTSFSARPYTVYHKSVMDFYNFAYSFSYRLLGYIHLPGLSLRRSLQLPCPLGCIGSNTSDLKGGAHFTTCRRLGQHLRAHGALEDVVLLAMQDAISHRAATGYAGAYLSDEKRSEARHNLATTIPITPIHGGEMDRGSFGDLLLVMNTALPASGDHLGTR